MFKRAVRVVFVSIIAISPDELRVSMVTSLQDSLSERHCFLIVALNSVVSISLKNNNCRI